MDIEDRLSTIESEVERLKSSLLELDILVKDFAKLVVANQKNNEKRFNASEKIISSILEILENIKERIL